MSVLSNVHVHLFCAHWAMLAPNHWQLRDVQNNFWRLYLHNHDGVNIEVNGESHLLLKDQLYFIPAGVRFNYATVQEVGQFYVHFDIIGLPHVAMRELFRGVIAIPCTPFIDTSAQRFAARCSKGGVTDLAMECGIKALIFESLAAYLDSVPATQMERYQRVTEDLQPVLPAINFLEGHIHEHLSNQQLAELCCVTPEYFIRRFRQCTGMTPVKYIQEYRVKIAAQQLAFSTRSIDEIATETGFGNRAYLSRIFTRLTGMSPAAYRRTLRT